MPEYLIYFNQQWVGDHTEEWFGGRGPLARAVVDEMKAAGAYVFAGGAGGGGRPGLQRRPHQWRRVDHRRTIRRDQGVSGRVRSGGRGR
jgi:hypothetical protein